MFSRKKIAELQAQIDYLEVRIGLLELAQRQEPGPHVARKATNIDRMEMASKGRRGNE